MWRKSTSKRRYLFAPGNTFAPSVNQEQPWVHCVRKVLESRERRWHWKLSISPVLLLWVSFFLKHWKDFNDITNAINVTMHRSLRQDACILFIMFLSFQVFKRDPKNGFRQWTWTNNQIQYDPPVCSPRLLLARKNLFFVTCSQIIVRNFMLYLLCSASWLCTMLFSRMVESNAVDVCLGFIAP